jgi:hypothetical protein
MIVKALGGGSAVEVAVVLVVAAVWVALIGWSVTQERLSRQATAHAREPTDEASDKAAVAA